MRVYRAADLPRMPSICGGSWENLDYLGQGGTLEPLFVGKIAVEHIRFVNPTLHRKVIHPAAVQPRDPHSPARNGWNDSTQA